MFNIRGELDSSYDQNIIGYIRSLSTTTQLPPSTAPTLLTLEVPNLSNTNTRYEAGSKIQTSQNGQFQVGDDVLLMGWTRASYRPYDKALFEPELRKVAKVVGIDEYYIYLDYAPPFNYPAFVNNELVKSVVMKVDLTENVVLKNINIKDMINEPLGTSSNSSHWADTPSGISELLAKNVEIQNYHMENHRFNALYAQYSNNLRHTNIYAKNAQWWGGGQGYVIQYIACDGVVNENIVGDACRHVVDVSWSSNVKTKTGRSYNPRAEDFTHHGCTEHNIIWEDCEGDIRFGHGIAYFPEIIENVTIQNCNISVRNNESCVVFDLVINQSRVKCFGFQNFSQVTYNNCDIRAFYITSAVAANNRNTGRTRHAIINDSKIDVKAFDGTRLVLGFYDYEILNFKNIEFNLDQSVLDLFTNQPVITLSNFKNAVIDGAEANQLCLSIRQTLHPRCALELVNSTINLVTKSGSDLLNFVTNQNTSISAKVLNNRINYDLTGSAGYANIFLLSGAVTNSTVIMNISGNHLIGSAPNTIQGRNSVGTGTTVYIQDFKNVIKNAGTNASFAFSNENIFI